MILFDPLQFGQLRAANIARLPQFKSTKGEPAHASVDGSDWTIAEWLNAVAGEAGEACNIAKKMRRGDYGKPLDFEYFKASGALAFELADVVTYADLACYQLRHDLGAAVRAKFNKVSERVESSIRLEANPVDPCAELRRTVRLKLDAMLSESANGLVREAYPKLRRELRALYVELA